MIDPTTPDAQHRIELALGATFEGFKVKSFQTDQLLVVIGSLIQQLEAQHRDLDFRLSVPMLHSSTERRQRRENAEKEAAQKENKT